MYGEINIDGVPYRTRDKKFTRNEIIIYETHAEVILYNKNNIECARAMVSLDKLEEVRKYAWCAYIRERSSYAVTSINGSSVKMHNILFNPPDGYVCDHIDRNGFNNQNDNIRFCTRQQNSFNVGPKKNNKSGYQGVYWNPALSKWRANIRVNGKAIFLGCYVELDDAIAARKAAEVTYFGEYAPA